MKFVVATNNGGKLQEFRDILKEFGHEAVSLKEVNIDRKSTRLNSSHRCTSRMPSSA